MNVDAVGVVGAGVIGVGVAESLAQIGHHVILLDVSQEILERARDEIRKSLRMQRFFAASKGDSADMILQRITFSVDYSSLKKVDFVIENVTEKWEVKKPIYAHLDEICPPRAVFGANTSAISITRLGSITNRADKVLGMHFMNPVPLKSLVEIVRGHHTSDETIEVARNLLARMNKECIVVNDMPGFVSNRVLMLTINEAIFLVQEQVAAVEEIDKIFRIGFGHKMGPLETADLIGLDTILYSIEVLYESFNDSKYRPCPMLRKMVEGGLWGRKSGQGFYTYR
jgi:3-hydroxybutyryl-CoA dehydrogenase